MLKPYCKGNGIHARRLSRGVTLLEALISLALGVIVTGAMVSLMGNSMGSATRIIEMSQLTDELRNTMHLITRDIRRANYSPLSHLCYGNSDCATDGVTPVTNHGDIVINNANDCVTFNLDREWNTSGVTTNNNGGGFQLVDDGGVGVIEMWIGGASPTCGNGNDWVPVTDPGFVDVTAFIVSDDDSWDTPITEEGGGTFTQRIRQINIEISAQLVMDNDINRTLVDEIRVRNDHFFH